jgi:ABC-2 type transport system ATP-binding protein
MAASSGRGGVQVKGPDVRKLGDILYGQGVTVSGTPEHITVQGKTGEEIGRLIAEHQIVISELSPIESSLEDIYFELTGATGTGGPS